jgi:hypothetical protein
MNIDPRHVCSLLLGLAGLWAASVCAGESPLGAQLRGLEGVRLGVFVEGEDIPMMVTEQEVRRSMRQALWEAGIWVFEDQEDTGDIGVLSLNFYSEAIEPALPGDDDETMRIYPIFITLGVVKPVYAKPGADGGAHTPMSAQIWWTEIHAWAVERRVRDIACVAVRKALAQFVEDYLAANAAGAAED